MGPEGLHGWNHRERTGTSQIRTEVMQSSCPRCSRAVAPLFLSQVEVAFTNFQNYRVRAVRVHTQDDAAARGSVTIMPQTCLIKVSTAMLRVLFFYPY